jgi:hypothetical protein
MPLIDWIVMFTLIALIAAVFAAIMAPRSTRPGTTAAATAGSGQPVLAAALSLLIPGAGHALVGAWGRGALWFAGFLLVAAASQALHGPLVVLLMFLAGFDAYQVARARGDRADASRPPGPTQGTQTSEEDRHEAT